MEIGFRARINEKGRAEHLAEWQHFTLDDLLDGHASELNERIDRKTICLSTTLRDKHGKEIWEGDRISFSVFDYNDHDTQYEGVIVYSGSRFMIWKSAEDEFYGSDGGFDLDWVLGQDDELEVIGSIYGEGE